MSHEPGRERHMTYLCEQCRRSSPGAPLIHRESLDEYWCESCIDDEFNPEHEKAHKR